VEGCGQGEGGSEVTRPLNVAVIALLVAVALALSYVEYRVLNAQAAKVPTVSTPSVVPAPSMSLGPRVPVDLATRSWQRVPIVAPSVPSPSLAARPTTTPSSIRVRSVPTGGPVVVPGKGSTTGPNVMAAIRWCESRDNYTAQNRYTTASGAYQFLDTTWQHLTGLPGHARDYSPAIQDAAFLKMYALAGTAPWNASRGCWASR